MISRRKFLGESATLGAAVLAERLAAFPENRAEVSESNSAIAPSGSPNVLIFMPDQQNGSTVLADSPVVKPNLDRFRTEAVTFTSAHCPAPHCCPSRASFMSGLYPSEHGVFNNVTTDTAIHPNPYPGTPFWGLPLKAAGYDMAYSGKLHVGRDVTPETCGFRNICSLEQDSLRQNEAAKLRQWQVARTEVQTPSSRKPGQILRPGWPSLQLYQTLPEDAYKDLADYRIMQTGIVELKRMAVSGQPWCLMISNSGSHDSYNAPRQFVDLYDPDKIELPVSFRDTLDDKPRVYQRQRYQYWSQLSDQETRDALRHYYAKCSMQDALFGELLQALDATGQRENTLVIYVSDHGDYHAAHGLWMKGIPSFREAYHIPAIIRWPKGIVRPGRQVDEFVDQVDWAPTILEACGVTPKRALSGASLLPWLRGDTPSKWRNATCTQMNGVELYYTQRITMTKEWKYVYSGFDFDELYDLRSDPHEMRNLAFPDLAQKRQAVLAGQGLPPNASVPWPTLDTGATAARKDLLTEMWSFAAEHRDTIFNPYGTVALAPLGPGLGPEPLISV